MGVTHEYDRYEAAGTCNLIASSSAFCHGLDSNNVIIAACEDVHLRNLRTDTKVLSFLGEKSVVTALRLSSSKQLLAVGYEDGSIKLFSLNDPGDAKVEFSGHKSAVTCLDFDKDSLRLLSGGKDTTLIVWDVVEERGLFKFKGHKGPVTQCRFLHEKEVVISSSKDCFIKFWDLHSQHCFYTVTGHRAEVWDFVLFRNGEYLLSAGAEMEMRLYKIEYLNSLNNCTDDFGLDGPMKPKMAVSIDDMGLIPFNTADENIVENQANNILRCEKVGTLLRKAKGRVTQLALSKDETFLAVVAHGSLIQHYSIVTVDELQKRVEKKLRKLRKKSAKTVDDKMEVDLERVKEEQQDNVADAQPRVNFSDAFVCLGEQKLSAKVSSVVVDTVQDKGSVAFKLTYVLANNSIEQYLVSVPKGGGYSVSQLLNSGLSQGHRTDIRALAFASDNSAFLSGAADGVKVWNRASLKCIRSLPSNDFVVCCMFAPGDRHCIVGTKTGCIKLFDISASLLLSETRAHTGAIWSLFLLPDQSGFVSGSADKEVKFWNFELEGDGENYGTSLCRALFLLRKQLVIVHKKTLQLEEDVMSVCVSSNGKYIAAALLDNTTKVFFCNTLKFFLSLYGHSLPVLCLDISSDNTLLVSGSADKNVKIWGLNFGDCHKSIFAHDDSVTCVKFVPQTHLFFSAGKDGKIKQWDADKFQKIQVLQGHYSEIWALAVSFHKGNFLVSAAHDKSIRLWERTEEPLIIEEEQEREREKDYDQAVAEQEDVIPGEHETEVETAAKKTVESVKSTESIIEALEICAEETLTKASQTTATKQERHPLIKALGNKTLEKFVVDIIKRIRSSELDRALIMLPFTNVLELLPYFALALENWYEVELCTRCTCLLLRIHHNQIVSADRAVPITDRLRKLVTSRVTGVRDIVGKNLAALRFLEMDFAERNEVRLFADAAQNMVEKRRKKKQQLLLDMYANAVVDD